MAYFLDYANNNQINIIPEKEAKELTEDVFKLVAENISRSLGPLGASAMIYNGSMSENTKDGYTILESYRPSNIYKKQILNAIRRPCEKMNNTVGDGTTTAVVLASSLFEVYQEFKPSLRKLYRLPRQFDKAWDEVVEDIRSRIAKESRPINIENGDVYNIAYIASNGNHEVSSTIENAYKNSGHPFIHIKDSPTNKSYMKEISGFEFPANCISPRYTRNDDLSSNLKDCYVMIFDHTINSESFEQVVTPILKHVWSTKKYLILLSPYFEKNVCDNVLPPLLAFELNKYNRIHLIPCQYRIGALDDDHLLDLVAVLNTKLITEDLEKQLVQKLADNSDEVWEGMDNDQSPFYNMLGVVNDVSISCKDGSIFSIGEMCEAHKLAIKGAKLNLEREIASSTDEIQHIALKTAKLQERVSRLELCNYIYYVGANSELQQQLLKASVTDTVLCLRSAMKHGVLPGCQISIYNAAKDVMEEMYSKKDELKASIAGMIEMAVMKTYSTILSGPNGDGMYWAMPFLEIDSSESPENYAKRVFTAACKDEKAAQDLIEKYPFNKDRNEESIREYKEIILLAIIKMATKAIILESMEKKQAYDLENLEFSDKIVTSAETDSMVLTTASELIKTLINTNQIIYIDPLLNPEHEETHPLLPEKS